MAKRRVTRQEAARIKAGQKAQAAAEGLQQWLGQQPNPAGPSPSANPSSSTIHAGSTIRASDPSILRVLGGKLHIPTEETHITEAGAVMSFKQHAPGGEPEWMHVADFPRPQPAPEAPQAVAPEHHVFRDLGNDTTGFSEEETQAVNEGIVTSPTGGRHPGIAVDPSAFFGGGGEAEAAAPQPEGGPEAAPQPPAGGGAGTAPGPGAGAPASATEEAAASPVKPSFEPQPGGGSDAALYRQLGAYAGYATGAAFGGPVGGAIGQMLGGMLGQIAGGGKVTGKEFGASLGATVGGLVGGGAVGKIVGGTLASLFDTEGNEGAATAAEAGDTGSVHVSAGAPAMSGQEVRMEDVLVVLREMSGYLRSLTNDGMVIRGDRRRVGGSTV